MTSYLFKRKKAKYYNIRFRRMIDGQISERQFSLKTTSKQIAKKLENRLLADQQLGKINIFDEFDFEEWKNPSVKQSTKVLLSALINEFLSEQTHWKDKTRKHYIMVLNLFLESTGQTMLIELLDRKDIIDFIFNPTYSTATQNNYLRHVKTFFNWLEKKEKGPNLASDISGAKEAENLKEQIVSEEELSSLFKVFENFKKQQVLEKQATSEKQKQLWFVPLVSTCYYTGLRLSEVINLKWKHVDLDKKQITVVDGKGGKSRTTVLINPMFEVLGQWKKHTTFERDRYVFESVKSNSRTSIPMGQRTIQKIFKQFVRLSGLSEDIHFHSLRHSCATNMLIKGFTLHEVQLMLGHSSISVTVRYLHLVPQDLNDRAKKLGLL